VKPAGAAVDSDAVPPPGPVGHRRLERRHVRAEAQARRPQDRIDRTALGVGDVRPG